MTLCSEVKNIKQFVEPYPVFSCLWVEPLGQGIGRLYQQKLLITVLNPGANYSYFYGLLNCRWVFSWSLKSCVTLWCFVRITQVHKKGQNSGNGDLDLKNLASLCPCCHKQYNLSWWSNIKKWQCFSILLKFLWRTDQGRDGQSKPMYCLLFWMCDIKTKLH